jgi:hypothetical protein
MRGLHPRTPAPPRPRDSEPRSAPTAARTCARSSAEKRCAQTRSAAASETEVVRQWRAHEAGLAGRRDAG